MWWAFSLDVKVKTRRFRDADAILSILNRTVPGWREDVESTEAKPVVDCTRFIERRCDDEEQVYDFALT